MQLTVCIRLFLSLALLISSIQVRGAEQEYVVWYKSLNEPLSMQMLQLLLGDEGTAKMPVNLRSSGPYTQGRAFRALAKGKGIDIVTGAPNLFREAHTQPIPVPINRGLLGVRLCLVKKGDTRLDSISSLKDIRDQDVIFGQGEHWPDTHVLESNGLHVVRNPVHENLFSMLRAGRFDCFPRAISEIDVELSQFGAEHFDVVSGFAIVYKLPLLFWTNPDDKQLTERLHLGMLKSVFNESYYQMTAQHFDGLLEKYQVANRHIIRLQNPHSSKLIAAIDERLWHPLIVGPD